MAIEAIGRAGLRGSRRRALESIPNPPGTFQESNPDLQLLLDPPYPSQETDLP